MEACYEIGLLTDDREFIDAIKEAENLGGFVHQILGMQYAKNQIKTELILYNPN